MTNYRDAVPPHAGHRSRGELVTSFIASDTSPSDYVTAIDSDAYAGFNLFVSDGSTLAYGNNRDGAPRELPPGIYGLANANLDAPWHKTLVSKDRLKTVLDSGSINSSTLLKLLDDKNLGPAQDVSTDGLDFRRAHAMTAPFIVQPDYGTRSSTVVLYAARGSIEIVERRFKPDGRRDGETTKTIQVASTPP